MACFVSNHVSWNTSWETLIYAMIDWPQIFCKGVSTVLGSLSALDTRDHTRSDWSSVFKTASRDSSELFREDMLKYFLSSLHRQKHNSERHKFYIFFILQWNKIVWKAKQNDHPSVVQYASFPSPSTSVTLTEDFPSDRCSFIITLQKSKGNLLRTALGNICISNGQDVFSTLA